LFKTHAYTPTGHGNFDTYTFHWDNIRFDGPRLQPYDVHQANDVVYLQANGDRPVGDMQTVAIDLPESRPNPVLFGQLHGALNGQVHLSINGGEAIPVHPDEYPLDDCVSGEWRDWKSFRLPLNPDWLQTGENNLTWTVGPRPTCAADQDWWDGYSVKFLQVQLDGGEDRSIVFEDRFQSNSR
ncbi:MAG: hypothetical protein AAGJ52_13460, partial [Pseudomonadota bacterium]